MTKNKEKRRRTLQRILHNQLSKVVKENHRVQKMLTSKEIEEGLQIVINQIVDDVLKKEEQLKRKLTLEELRECIMKALDRFAPETRYIV